MKSNLWRLDKPSEKTIQAYRDKFLDPLKESIKKSDLDSNVKLRLLEGDKLEQLLTGEADSLLGLNDEIMKEIGLSNTEEERKKIENAFNYSNLLSNNKDNSYWLAKIIQRNTCVYCNRHYIFTVVAPKLVKGKKKIYVTRPEFDHWYPKSKYPLLSMSLFNLIPSCHICNRLKGVKDVGKKKDQDQYQYIHPYIHKDKEPDITFRVSLTAGPDPEWTIKLDCGENDKEKAMMDVFKLNEIYAFHGNLEVKDIMKFNEAYTEGYIKTLFTKVLEDSHGIMTRHEVYRFFFGTEMEPDKFLDRPLSKMKYDILKYLRFL